MRILEVIQSLKVGGAERVCLDLSHGLLDQGHSVTIVMLQDRRDLLTHTDLDKLDIRALLPGQSPIFVKSLYQLSSSFSKIYHEGWDVVHCHMDGALIVAALGGAIGVCYTVHNSVHRHWEGYGLHRIRAFAERLIASRADVTIVGCGPGAAAWAKQHLAQGRKTIYCISNGIDLSRYVFKTLPWEYHSPLRILMVGKLVPAKDHEMAINAAARLVKCGLDIQLWLVGEGSLRDHLERLIDNLELQDKIKFLGVRHDVPQLMHAADLFWLTSRHEGLPLVLLEAMACGIPVIVTRAPGIQEIADVAGLPQCPIADSENLAEVTLDLLGKVDTVEFVRKKNRLLVERSYSLTQMTADYLRIFQANSNARS